MSSRPSSINSMAPTCARTRKCSTTKSVKPSKTKSMKPASTRASNSSNTKSSSIKSRGSRRSRNSKKSVSFGVVHVREYERIIGDHPAVCDNGPALGLGWRYKDNEVERPVDSFENSHCSRNNPIKPLKGTTRSIILEVYGIPRREIFAAAQKAASRTKQQRKESTGKVTKHHGKNVGKALDVIHSTTRRMRRLM